MSKQAQIPSQYDGNPKFFVMYFKIIEAKLGSYRFKYGVKVKKHMSLSFVYEMATKLADLPDEDASYADLDLENRMRLTESKGFKISDRSKSIMRDACTELNSERKFISAQKEAFDVILAHISPDLLEIEQAKFTDLFVASRLLWKLLQKHRSYASENIASINEDLQNFIAKFRDFAGSVEDVKKYMAEVTRRHKMSLPAKDHYSEQYIVKLIGRQLERDPRLKLQGIGEKTQDARISSLEELELQISNKIASDPVVDQPSTIKNTSTSGRTLDDGDAPQAGEAFYTRFRHPRNLTLVAKHGPRQFKKKQRPDWEPWSPPSDSYGLPRIEKVPSEIWDSWTEAQRKLFVRKKREFKTFLDTLFSDLPHDAKVAITSITSDSDYQHPSVFHYGHTAMLAEALESPCSLQATQFGLPPLKDEEVFAEELAALTELDLDEVPRPWQSVEELPSTTEVLNSFERLLAIDCGSSDHIIKDAASFTSLQPCHIPISTAKQGEVMWALGIGEAHVKTLNASGTTELLTLRNALYVPDVKQDLISCSALLKDCYQIILPSSMALFPAGIHNGRAPCSSPDTTIPIFQIGSLFYIKAFESVERYSDNEDEKTPAGA